VLVDAYQGGRRRDPRHVRNLLYASRTPTIPDIEAIAFITQTAALAIERHRSDQQLKRNEEQLREINAQLAYANERLSEREAALRGSEEQMRALLSTSSEVLYRMSPDWTEMRELAGGGFLADTISPNEAWLSNYIHPEDQDLVDRAIRHAIATKGVFNLEHRVLQEDGSVGWTVSHAVPILDAASEIREWFGAASDVTSRKRADESLRASEQRLRLIVENVRDYAIFFTDRAGLITDWLPGAVNVFGCSVEEAVWPISRYDLHSRRL
jgi:PAS domain-containing protein